MDPFSQAAALLPPSFRRRAEALSEPVRRRAEELRLRTGQIPTVTLEGRERPFPGEISVKTEDLERTLEISTRASVQTALEKLRQGWFTAPGGHRLGLCGEASMTDGGVFSLRQLSSLNIRIARQVPGCAAGVFQKLKERNFPNTLLLSPPGVGKTTLLRDLVRLLSRDNGPVGLCDERGEVAALCEGIPRFDVGEHTDVLDGCPKAEGLLMLLRGMGPRFLACDEITRPADCEALRACAGCGVKLLATAHGSSPADLDRRKVYRNLRKQGLFQTVVLIERQAGKRLYLVENLPC